MTSTAMFVGIDIAKTDVVVACRPDGASWTAPNDLPGITATVDRVRALAPTLIVLEATGGYETPLVAALAAAGLPVEWRIRGRSDGVHLRSVAPVFCSADAEKDKDDR